MIEVYYVEGTNLEVVSICEQYASLLTSMISDFDKKNIDN